MKLLRTAFTLWMATSLAWTTGCNDGEPKVPSRDWDISESEALPIAFSDPLVGAGPAELRLLPWLQSPSDESMAVMVELVDAQTPAAVYLRRAGSPHAHRVIPMEATSADGLIRLAHIDALSSNAFYEYQIVLGEGSSIASKTVSERYVFRTWPAPEDGVERTSVIAISDTQYNYGSNINILRNIVEEGIMGHECSLADPITCADALSGILIAGDIVEFGSMRAHWRDEFFGRVEAISPYVPIIAATGNHDYMLDNKIQHFVDYFEGPRNGSEGFEDRWFHLSLNGVRLVVLDSYPVSRMLGDFRQETLDLQRDWLRSVLDESDDTFAVGVFHHGCLSELWTMGESVGSCEFVSEFERWSVAQGRLSAHLFGHTHGYSRGQSRDTHHLWLNSASASGDLEPMHDVNHYDNHMHDYDTFHVSRSEYGYSVIDFALGERPTMTVTRRQGGHTQGVEYPIVDTNSYFIGDAPAAPTLLAVEESEVGPELVLESALDDLFEVHWQFSRSESFDGALYDIWGNFTRRENFFYERGHSIGDRATGYEPIDFQESVDIRRIQPFPLISTGTVLAGDFDQWRRWTKPGASSNTQVSIHDPWAGGEPEVLEISEGSTLYFRARVRDSALNWSTWSTPSTVTF